MGGRNAEGRRDGLCSRWRLALCAITMMIALGSAGTFALASSRVPELTPEQERRGITTTIGHHSFAPPFLRYYYGDGEVPHWSISGNTVITDRYIRLTADQMSQVGHLWNTEPLDMDAFELVVGFRVHRLMGDVGADGFGLWIAQTPRFDGPLMGRPATFNGFGILFDSYDNDNRRDNPMVSLVVNDGSNKKRFNPEADFMGETVANCVFDYRGVFPPTMATMRMVYNKGSLRLLLSTNSEKTETECFSVRNVAMPTEAAYLSFSAQTGAVSENHDLIFVHLSPLEDAEYDHDVRVTTIPQDALHDAQIYDNDAMNNRRKDETTTTTTTTTTSAPTVPPHQEQQQQQQHNPPPHQEEQKSMHQSAQQPLDPAAAEEQRIEELKQLIAELRREKNARTARHTEDDDFDDVDEEELEQLRRAKRNRRARTPRRNRVDYDE